MAGQNDAERAQFILSAINDHVGSAAYKKAKDAQDYAEGKNVTISQYQKLLYTITGKAVPDNYTANHKTKSGFFKIFVNQEISFALANGITFEKPETETKLGRDAEGVIFKAGLSALIQGCSFVFFNFDHLEFFKFTEFVPLYDEMTGTLKAGIRFWQIAPNKPMKATLFELDGYTGFEKNKDGELLISIEKQSYTKNIIYSEADGEVLEPGENYPGFPVIPLWANFSKQSELEGIREQIDCYDLIKSGFANDLDDASMIYWTITGAGGMRDVDLVKFIERMKTIRAASVGGDEVKAESHTIEVPYQSRETYLSRLREDLYSDAMALDVSKISAGNVTATQIRAAYEPLIEKTEIFYSCLLEFFHLLFAVAGIEDEPKFEYRMIFNQAEITQMVLSAASYLDAETILRKLPFLDADEVDGIMERKQDEEAMRYVPETPVMQEEEEIETGGLEE